jgi:antitoxin PrlF
MDTQMPIFPDYQYYLINQKKLNNIDICNCLMNMNSAEKSKSYCTPGTMGCCKVESIVSVDERGQMVLPKEIREKAKIKAGDKLAVVSMEKNGQICCLSLIKVEELESMVKSMLGPVMEEVLKR